MSYLVDTNVIAELRKGSRCNPNVAAWFGRIESDEIFLSVLVVGEIRKGIESVRRRDPAGARALETWLGRVMAEHGDRILQVDLPIAEEWGHLSVPDPVPPVDGLLAATAKRHDLVLVTRNVRHVQGTGVAVLDPFLAQA